MKRSILFRKWALLILPSFSGYHPCYTWLISYCPSENSILWLEWGEQSRVWQFWLFGGVFCLVSFLPWKNSGYSFAEKKKWKCTGRRSSQDLNSQMSVSYKMILGLTELRYCPGIFCSACQPPCSPHLTLSLWTSAQ